MRPGWQEVPVRFAATLNPEQLADDTDPDYRFRYVDISSVSQGEVRLPDEETRFAEAPSRARRIARAGDTVASTVRTYLRAIAPAVDEEDVIYSTGFAVLRPRSESADGDYVRYALQADPFIDEVVANSEGVSYPAINAADMVRLKFWLPPLAEQRAIAAYLDRETAEIDALVSAQEGLIATLRERRAAVIDRFFDPRESTTPLSQALRASLTGPFGTQLAASEYVDGGVPFINPTHIRNNRIAPDPSHAVSPAKADELSRFRLKSGDLVLGRKGDVDKCALVSAEEDGYLCGSDAIALRPGDRAIPAFVWWFLHSAWAVFQLNKWSVGATVVGLNQTTISKMRMPLPPLDEQHRIADYLDEKAAEIDTLIVETERFIALAKERRAALITAAVTGQIDVGNGA